MTRIVGTSVERVDAAGKARGIARYGADYYAPGMFHCVLVRSSRAHARIKGLSIPVLPDGVFCYTARNLVSNLIPSIMNDQPVFADGHVRYYGEPVALVAAQSYEEARKYAALVGVDYEDLPVLDDYEKALDDDAPKLFENGNLCTQFHNIKGDVDKAFAQSAFVFEESFRMPVQCHGFMEPECAFTYMDGEGRLALVSSTQNAWSDKLALCSVLGLEEDRVTSTAAAVGGAFGGKDGVTSQIYPAIVTHFTGMPAKLVFTREENIRYGMKRHQGTVRCRAGFSSDGHITALQGYMILDTGAYAVLGPAVLGLGLEHMSGPYYIPNVKLDGHLVYTNHAMASAMRGFGAPQGAIGIETFLNRAAERLGMDPLHIRKINAIHENQEGSMGGRILACTKFEEALDRFARSPFAKEMNLGSDDPDVGYGVAAGMMSCGMGKGVPDTVHVNIERTGDGGFAVSTSLVDIGQGGQTALAMIAAEALGVPMEKIDMRMGMTDGQGNSGSTAASRSTYVAGNAIIKAAEGIRSGKDRASASFSCPETPENAIHRFFSYMVLGVKVKVDRLTGEIRVLKAHNVTEAGNIINPEMMAGQAFGGIVMSEGYTLSEQVRYRNGVSMEDSLNSYVMPTSLDAPHLSNENVEAYEKTGPFGAKGVAECSTVAMAPAIIAAVNKVVPGVNITSLPIDRLSLIRRS